MQDYADIKKTENDDAKKMYDLEQSLPLKEKIRFAVFAISKLSMT